MKIAVSAMGDTPQSDVAPQFAHTKGLMIHNNANGEYEFIELRPHEKPSKAVSLKAAETALNLDVDAVISEEIDIKSVDKLKEKDIEIYLSPPSTVEMALRALKNGDLTRWEREA